MAKRNVPDDGWSEEGGAWFNSLSIEEVVDLMSLVDYGVEDEADKEKLAKFRESYEQATGETWE